MCTIYFSPHHLQIKSIFILETVSSILLVLTEPEFLICLFSLIGPCKLAVVTWPTITHFHPKMTFPLMFALSCFIRITLRGLKRRPPVKIRGKESKIIILQSRTAFYPLIFILLSELCDVWNHLTGAVRWFQTWQSGPGPISAENIYKESTLVYLFLSQWNLLNREWRVFLRCVVNI